MSIFFVFFFCWFLSYNRLLGIPPSVKGKNFGIKNQSCPGKRPKMSEESWSITTSQTEGKLKALNIL